MVRIYEICILIGILIPLISLCFRFVDTCIDFVSIDALDFDMGDFHISLLPFSINSLCLASVMFGGISWLLIDKEPLKRHIIAGVIAYFVAVLLQTMVNYLRKNQTEAESKEQLLNQKGIVVNRIAKGGFGSIQLGVEGNSVINLTAKSVDGTEILQGSSIIVLEILENDVAIVKEEKEN